MKRLFLFLTLCVITNLVSAQTTDTLRGYATYYAAKFNGRRTANGERFNQNKYTAASNNFPIGTILKVTNLTNCQTVTVRINDRMHPRMAKKRHIVDLSTAAAKKLKFYGQFIVKVEVVVVEPYQTIDY